MFYFHKWNLVVTNKHLAGIKLQLLNPCSTGWGGGDEKYNIDHFSVLLIPLAIECQDLYIYRTQYKSTWTSKR
jgi:hypothetical protein